jgi:ligand-binding SRPBCC domain-containing protein
MFADHVLDAKVFVTRPIDEVFEFFSRAENLGRITPPELDFQVTTPIPIAMEAGVLIDYRIALHGLTMRWRTLISVWEPPHRFVDEQLQGPYSRWIHTHTFESAPGGTTVRDHVRYRLPFDPFGRIALPLVRRQLKRIFEFRTSAVKQLLESDSEI